MSHGQVCTRPLGGEFTGAPAALVWVSPTREDGAPVVKAPDNGQTRGSA